MRTTIDILQDKDLSVLSTFFEFTNACYDTLNPIWIPDDESCNSLEEFKTMKEYYINDLKKGAPIKL